MGRSGFGPGTGSGYMGKETCWFTISQPTFFLHDTRQLYSGGSAALHVYNLADLLMHQDPSKTTFFGKHCECIAQKCTHLERLPPLACQLLLLSHCVLTQHGGQKQIHSQGSDPGKRTRVGNEYTVRIRHLRYSISRTQLIVLNSLTMTIYLKFNSQLLLRTEKFS